MKFSASDIKKLKNYYEEGIRYLVKTTRYTIALYDEKSQQRKVEQIESDEFEGVHVNQDVYLPNVLLR